MSRGHARLYIFRPALVRTGLAPTTGAAMISGPSTGWEGCWCSAYTDHGQVHPHRQGRRAHRQLDDHGHDHAGGVKGRGLASLLRRHREVADASLRATPPDWKPGRATAGIDAAQRISSGLLIQYPHPGRS